MSMHPQQSVSLPFGYIFYIGSRRRVQVQFTEELRTMTRATIERAFRMAVMKQPPQPLDASLAFRCEQCSMRPLCLPDEVRLLHMSKEGA